MELAIKSEVCLKNYTTWRIGGKADRFAVVKTVDELTNVIKIDKSPTIIGGGSNVLIADSGIRGLVIKNQMHRIKESSDIVVVDSGTALSLVANYYYLSSYGDLYWAHLIPGTVGGALKSNAGAHGGNIGDIVEWVEIFRDGDIVRLSNSECGFGYRISKFKSSDIIIRAGLRFSRDNQSNIAIKRHEAKEYRKNTQPVGFSAGSVFKAIPSPRCLKRDYFSAGFYIERAGLKGTRVGGAVVSHKHANFILNDNSATCADVLELIATIKLKVYKTFGVALKEEVCFLC